MVYVMAMARSNPYREANKGEAQSPVDDELERRLRHGDLNQRILSMQDQVVAVLGQERSVYLRLEELQTERTDGREEAMFNLGFEHGLLQGRTDAMGALWRKSVRGRSFAARLARLTAETGLDRARAVTALLEIAWSLSIPRRRRATRASKT
jgi:hypothetical protein